MIGTGTGRAGSTPLQENALQGVSYEVSMGNAGGEHLDFWLDAYSNNCSNAVKLQEMFESGNYSATVHAINYPCVWNHRYLICTHKPR